VRFLLGPLGCLSGAFVVFLRSPAFGFGAGVLLLGSSALGVGATRFLLEQLRGPFGPFALPLGPLALLAGSPLLRFEATLEVFDCACSLEPRSMSLFSSRVLLLGALVFLVGALLLPVRPLPFVLDALERFVGAPGLLFGTGMARLGPLELSRRPLPFLGRLGLIPCSELAFRLCASSLGFGALSFLLGALVLELEPIAFALELVTNDGQAFAVEP
jgi:hypothetical protein